MFLCTWSAFLLDVRILFLHTFMFDDLDFHCAFDMLDLLVHSLFASSLLDRVLRQS